MSSLATQTIMTWSIRGDLACIEFLRGGEHYIFAATPSTLSESLRLVGECAADAEQCLTWDDAVRITESLRQIVLSMPAPVPTAVESLVEADSLRVGIRQRVRSLVAFGWAVIYFAVRLGK